VRFRLRTLLGFALACAPGCRSSEARRFEADVAGLGRRIDALRDAPNAAKRPLLAALDGAACEHPDACELKTMCVSAYTRHLDALAANDRVKTMLAEPDGGANAALAAAAELARAERDLELARSQTERCATLQGELRRRSQAP